jgi:hypothetical protein
MGKCTTITLEVEEGVVKQVYFNGKPADDESFEALCKDKRALTQHVTTIFYSQLPSSQSETNTQLCCHLVWQGGRWVTKCEPC